jgi:hypothetical protein
MMRSYTVNDSSKQGVPIENSDYDLTEARWKNEVENKNNMQELTSLVSNGPDSFFSHKAVP